MIKVFNIYQGIKRISTATGYAAACQVAHKLIQQGKQDVVITIEFIGDNSVRNISKND